MLTASQTGRPTFACGYRGFWETSRPHMQRSSLGSDLATFARLSPPPDVLGSAAALPVKTETGEQTSRALTQFALLFIFSPEQRLIPNGAPAF